MSCVCLTIDSKINIIAYKGYKIQMNGGNSMICQKCKNEISEESAFCPKCGAKIATGDSKERSKNKFLVKWGKGIVIGVGIIVGLIAIIGIIYIFHQY